MVFSTELPEAWQVCFDAVRRLPAFAAYRLEWVPETGSTSDDLKQDWAMASVPARLRVAGHQTSGRGQFDRSWVDLPGSALLCSFSLEVRLETLHLVPVPLHVGTAIWSALRNFVPECDREYFLKWPNDVWSREGKIGGILVESSIRGDHADLVIGLGVNISGMPSHEGFQADFLQRKSPDALSLPALLLEFCRAWDQLSDVAPEAVLARYRLASAGMLGKRYAFSVPSHGQGEGVAVGIDDHGCLVLELPGGARRCLSSLIEPLREKKTGRP